MNKQPVGGLLGPRGLPMVNLSGDRAWKQFTKGDVIASLQWVDVKAFDPQFEEEGPVPCMCLFHAHRRVETGSYVIPQLNAFKYASSGGNSVPPFFARIARDIVAELGFDANDKAAWHRCFDLVLEAMPDLIRMPSDMPADLHVAKRIEGIEVTVRHGENVILQEVR